MVNFTEICLRRKLRSLSPVFGYVQGFDSIRLRKTKFEYAEVRDVRGSQFSGSTQHYLVPIVEVASFWSFRSNFGF